MSRKPTKPIDHKILADLGKKLEVVRKANDWEYSFLRDVLNGVKFGEIKKLSFMEMRKVEYMHRKYCQ